MMPMESTGTTFMESTLGEVHTFTPTELTTMMPDPSMNPDSDSDMATSSPDASSDADTSMVYTDSPDTSMVYTDSPDTSMVYQYTDSPTEMSTQMPDTSMVYQYTDSPTEMSTQMPETSMVYQYTDSPTEMSTQMPDVCDNHLDIALHTSSWGNEIEWELEGCSGTGYSAHNFYMLECCLPFGTYTLHCTDSYGDGWNGGYLMINGEKYCHDFTTGHSQTVSVDIGPTTTPEVIDTSDCIDTAMILQSSSWGNEITWNIADICMGTGYGNYQTNALSCCLPTGEYELECVDSWGDGWHGAYIEIDGHRYCEDFTWGHTQTETVVFGTPSETEIASKLSVNMNSDWFPIVAIVSGSLNLIFAVLFSFYCIRACCCSRFSEKEQDQVYAALLDDDEV